MFCGQDTLIGDGKDDLVLHVLYCKRWSCPTCFPRRLMRLRREAAAGEPTTFITLTCRPDRYDDEHQAARDLVRCWRLIRQHLIRDGATPHIPFIAVFEGTRRGWPHLHILARMPYVPQATLSRLADAYISAPVVDIRRIYNRRMASRYVAKYVAKGPAGFAGSKRYWRSHDYDESARDAIPVADRARRWWHEREHIDYIVWALARYGWLIVPDEQGLQDDHTARGPPGTDRPTTDLQNCDADHGIEHRDRVTMVPLDGARWLWPAKPRSTTA